MEEKEFLRRPAPAKREITERTVIGGFTYPFGAYPEAEFTQQPGFDSKYIKEGGYFYYQVAVSHQRALEVFYDLAALLPAKVYLVAQVHTDDYYKESDTYITENPEDRDEFLGWVRDWADVVGDDGFFGLGMFAEDPTAEVFLDEHKTIHVYHHNPDLIEAALERLHIPFLMDMKMFWDQPHYHEPLPLVDEYSEDYLTAFEDLADRYELILEEDEAENLDEQGAPLGMTCWKVDVRGYRPVKEPGDRAMGFYSTVYVNAESRFEATDLIDSYMEGRNEFADLYLQMARVPEELLTTGLRRLNPGEEPGVWYETERVEFEWDGAQN